MRKIKVRLWKHERPGLLATETDGWKMAARLTVSRQLRQPSVLERERSGLGKLDRVASVGGSGVGGVEATCVRRANVDRSDMRWRSKRISSGRLTHS